MCWRGGSSVIIVTRLKAGRLKKFLVRNPAREIEFSLLQISKPAFGSTQPSIRWIPKALKLGVKWP
jgi:hypothetical protein